ncbi:DUF222 domain-containing protein [Mycolicibacterium sp.]|uniref:DUF222 domain-containing protein n=1 Tax=Mycolicibacterium sp. TaxID=2320850 RepID=UPI0037C950D3
MSSAAAPLAPGPSPVQRLEVLFEEMAELCGQRNAIDGRLVEIVAEIDRDELWGATGARSMTALVAWKTGITPHNADTMLAVARRRDQFPQCTQALSEGRLSLDQVGVIAERVYTAPAHRAPKSRVPSTQRLCADYASLSMLPSAGAPVRTGRYASPSAAASQAVPYRKRRRPAM